MLCLFFPFVTLVGAAQAQDAAGCKDSPLVARFPGSVIASCEQKADNSFAFNMGNGKPNKTIEGNFLRLNYNFPKTASKVQVVRNMNTAMKNAGYTFDYDSGDYGDFTVHSGKTWIQIEISGGGSYRETIVVETALAQEVVANAAALSTGLQATGHMVVLGILFDTGKADVKPESGPALEQVVKLLQGDPKLKLFVVGHTDNLGQLASTPDLSHRRAEAVVQMLIAQYKIAEGRLSSFGDGPYAPRASNDSEDGRALNRRVELVKH
jgi:outer membrane protein OmpA-like peptidoglycan-associated protein